jgi:prefoldin alpha subunit
LSQDKEQQLRRLITEIRMMEGTVETLNQRLSILTSATAELRLAQRSLNDLKEIDQKNPLLVPIGGGAFVYADLGDISKIVIGIGADTSIEMDYAKAVQNILERLTEMERAQTSVQQQILQVIAQLESHQAVVQKLSAEFQGASSV